MMSGPIDNGMGYNADPVNRAPSPYHQQQDTANDYYNPHPQQYDPAVQVSHNTRSFEGPGQAPAGESERGLIGALGGAGVGGYIGKQNCHGVLGTVGGAIIGSLTEDWARKKKPLCGSRPQSCHNSRPSSPQPPPAQPACDSHKPYEYPGTYSPPHIDTHTTVNSSTHIQPGIYHPGNLPMHLPVYNPHPPPAQKPCGHSHPCGCHFFGHHK